MWPSQAYITPRKRASWRSAARKIASGTNLSAERLPQRPCRAQQLGERVRSAPAPGARCAQSPGPRAVLEPEPASAAQRRATTSSRIEAVGAEAEARRRSASGCRRRSAPRAGRARGPGMDDGELGRGSTRGTAMRDAGASSPSSLQPVDRQERVVRCRFDLPPEPRSQPEDGLTAAARRRDHASPAQLQVGRQVR